MAGAAMPALASYANEGDRLLELDRRADESRPAHTTQPMRLHAMDAWVRDASVLTNANELRAVLYAATEAGGATVVGERFYAFPNGAVTGVLLLAQSHLTIHTWPELRLANIDLLTCGDIDGGLVLMTIRERLDVEQANVRCIERALD
jgi:S-adenosylmethionine decarboxylase